MPKVSAELFKSLRDFLRRVRPARHELHDDDEAWLCRYCAALALVDVKHVRSLRSGEHPLRALPPGSTLDDLFGLIPREAVIDIRRLSRRFQKTTGREWLSRSVTFDPHVWVANIGASPDVLVDDCLLDLKTAMRPHLDRLWLDQLLLYTLVVGDRRKVKRLGYHLVRQDRTVYWPVEEFLARAAGVAEVDVEGLSQEFFSIAARSSFLPREKRWGEPTRSGIT